MMWAVHNSSSAHHTTLRSSTEEEGNERGDHEFRYIFCDVLDLHFNFELKSRAIEIIEGPWNDFDGLKLR